MNKYDFNELSAAIKVALNNGVKASGKYDCLMFIPNYEQNEEGYIDAKRFGYNKDTDTLDYLGCTDIMPWEIDYKDYNMDFVPGGINIFRKDRKKFEVFSIYYCNTIIK